MQISDQYTHPGAEWRSSLTIFIHKNKFSTHPVLHPVLFSTLFSKIQIRVHAAGVNPVDTYIRSGTNSRRPTLPYTPGGDSAGVVTKVGKNVKNFNVNSFIRVESFKDIFKRKILNLKPHFIAKTY